MNRLDFWRVRLLFAFVFTSAMIAQAKCPVDEVLVKGRVEHAPQDAKVRVQLIYPHRAAGELGETKLEGTEFVVRVGFFTQSRGPRLFGEWLERCERKPESIVVALMRGNPLHEYDLITLKLSADFKQVSLGSYALKSEIVLHGPH